MTKGSRRGALPAVLPDAEHNTGSRRRSSRRISRRERSLTAAPARDARSQDSAEISLVACSDLSAPLLGRWACPRSGSKRRSRILHFVQSARCSLARSYPQEARRGEGLCVASSRSRSRVHVQAACWTWQGAREGLRSIDFPTFSF